MYFESFNQILYVFNEGDKTVVKPIIDISTNLRFFKESLQAVTLYETYRIQDGDTPEIVAFKAYGSTDKHWIVMMANDINDYQTDWPLSTNILSTYIVEKYNTFEASSWSYSGINITVTIPGHNIVVTEPEDVTVDNMVVNVDGQIKSIPPIQGVLRLMSSDIEAGTVTLKARGVLYGAPVPGFTLHTSNREHKTIHHYEKDGLVTYEGDPGAVGVSCYDYEVALNETKREIKLVDSATANRVNTELRGMMA